MASRTVARQFTPFRGEFGKRPLPVVVFLVGLAAVPFVQYWVVRSGLTAGLGWDLTQLWPRIAGTAVGALLLLGLALAVLRWEAISLRQIGCSWRDILLGGGWFLGIVVSLNVLLLLAAVTVADSYTVTAGGLSVAAWLGLAVANWLFVGVAEEVAVRGYLQNKFVTLLDGDARLRRRAAGIALTAVVFALLHVPQRLVVAELTVAELPSSLALLAAMAVVLGVIYELTRNLVLVALLHGAWNVPPVFFSIYGTQTWQSIVLLLAIALPVVVGIVLYWRLVATPEHPDVFA